MRTLFHSLAAVLTGFFILLLPAVAATPHDDIPIGSLPAESVTATLRKTLSPQGRFVILAVNGTVRVFDTPEKIEEARRALNALQNAPSIVSFAMNFKIGARKVTRGPDPGPIDYEIPVPDTYTAPRVAGQGNGGGVVVPGQPATFTTRHAAPGDRVYVNPGYVTGGYVTGTQVITQTTGWEGGIDRRFAGSTAYPKPVAIAVSKNADDPQGLHDWAVKAGAVPLNEPAWPAAATEILVTPEHADNGLLLNLLPVIVLPAANGQPARRIHIKICATSILTKPGVPATLDEFPSADADFYRLFFNAPESVQGTSVLTTVAAANQYVTQ